MEEAFVKGISFWNRLFLDRFLYGKGLFAKAVPYGKDASWNKLFVEWFPYGKGMFVNAIPY